MTINFYIKKTPHEKVKHLVDLISEIEKEHPSVKINIEVEI
jgi:hypothetical protein